MKPIRRLFCRRIRRTKGAAFVTSMIFVLVFSALAVSMATMSGTNLQISENQREADCARACAESGLEIMRFWLSRCSATGDTDPALVFHTLADSLQADLAANDITNITTSHDSSTITIPSVILDTENEKSFSAQITQLDPETLRMDVTGVYKDTTKTIRTNYTFGVKQHTVFDYGVATKGPLSLSGNIELEGINVNVESDVYIVSENDLLALSIIGNSSIAGDVHIWNPAGTVDLQGGKASIGGVTAPEAYDHVITGADEVDFPVLNPEYFEHYVVEDLVYPTTNTTFENIRIPPNTNPSFEGGTTISGIVYIETPNVVTFTGNVTITGIVVGDGDITDDSGTNRIDFLGTVDSSSVTALPEEFGDLREETGTFLMAPGFSVSFGGTFETINGAIAANGITFYGNAGGIIEGSVVNYSDVPMTLSGNSDLYFNRSANTEIPAGFFPEIVLKYEPASYSEGPF
jgi:Tfp pilus assembly protein PilX/cytoskeletal protein CcmA (bactofilin family)